MRFVQVAAKRKLSFQDFSHAEQYLGTALVIKLGEGNYIETGLIGLIQEVPWGNSTAEAK
jgi:hypothetical protein